MYIGNGEVKQWVHLYLIMTLLGIYDNEDIFDQDEHIRIFTTVFFVCIKKLKTYVSYLELHNI